MAAPCRREPSRDERIVSLLRDLVRVNTEHAAPEPGAPYGRGCARALDLALGECERRGLATHRVNEKIAWAETGDRGPLAAFPVHLDVVPAGEGWSRDPYAAEVEDGVLYGRGAADNKVSAAILIELLGEAARGARGGEGLPCRLRLVFGTDEETGMSDAAEYVAAGEEMPSLGFVPDASFPAVRGEKARLHLRLSREAEGAEGLSVCAGTAANVVPSSARAVLPDGRELRQSGRSAHGSTPERGENAACALVRALVAEGRGGDALAEVERLLCRDLTGAALGVDVPDQTFGGTSMNLGTLFVEGGRLEAELDLRLGTALGPAEAVGRVRATLGPAWEVEVVQEKPLHLVPEDDPCLQVLLAAYEEVTGDCGSAGVMAGGTYASHFPALVAFGPKLPGAHSGAHGPDEHVTLEDISVAAAVYEAALRNIVALAAAGR